MDSSPLLNQLIDALTVLPGVGQKSAQRMALHLLDRDREGAKILAHQLGLAMERIGRCRTCRTFTELDQCAICANDARDSGLLCVVETPSDQWAIESSQHYSGKYFVLMGNLSPLDGRGPSDIGIDELVTLVKSTSVREVILATNPTIEGEATAHYITELLANDEVLVTRLAHGLPVGGELGYVDGNTITHAFSGRKPVERSV